MLQSLILIDALSSAYWEKKKEREKQPGGFFPRVGHALLAVLHGVFTEFIFQNNRTYCQNVYRAKHHL
jgi:hypothetical protein